MNNWVWWLKFLLPIVMLFGGLVATICAQPPWQYVGAVVFLVMFVYGLIESHRRYHPRQKR